VERTVHRYSFEQPQRLDPMPLYARLRSHEPVARVRVPYGREAWLVTRHNGVRTVFNDPRFSRALAAGPDAPRRCPAWTPPKGIISLDPPDHTRVRKLFAKAFSMRGVNRLRPWAEQAVAGLLDELESHGPPADLVPTLLQRVPVMTICEVLGIPYDELVVMAELLLSNGYETTANELTNFVYVLLTHPDQLAWLRGDLSRVPTAVEELLRFVPLAAGVPSAGGHSRVATEDIELDGVTIAAGDAVLPAVNSANRDERVFADPDRLDLGRADANAHITFGYGPHHCLGAQLARMQSQLIITALLSRFPTLRLAREQDEIPWETDAIQRHPTELLVTW
jgi:cytochrome P450